MTDKLESNQQLQSETFLSKSAVIFVRIFGSWASVIAHTLIFAGWFIFDINIEKLLMIVSIEAIYIGIFILMAENIETAQRERLREVERKKDMAVVKQDVVVDKKSLKEVQEVHQKVDQIQKLIKKN
jgi:uncharacterized membrane protein